MNFVFISPHFPPNYYHFAVQLNKLGASVFGIADEPYNWLRPSLKNSLNEYYQVQDMHDYDQLLRACGYLTHAHGKIDRIESLNEYWLEIDARLRTDFNVFGLKTADMPAIKRKSVMKELFNANQVRTGRGEVVNSLPEAEHLADEIGFPLVAKPDIGVGAARTYKIHNPAELKHFFQVKSDTSYLLEEFISGTIFTFDGLTDRDGNIVFYTSHVYSQGVMEAVNDNTDIYYYSLREIPTDLETAGRKLVKIFKVKERFFHFEFFRADKDDELLALEVNIRPPGGLTTDMFNFANEIDIYHEWAHVILHNKFTVEYSRPYHCCFVGRRDDLSYVHTNEEIMHHFGPYIVHTDKIRGAFRAAMGDHAFLIRAEELDQILEITKFIQEKRRTE